MASAPKPKLHYPVWDFDTKRPIVGGKIEDPVTGEVRDAGERKYNGPPHVDVVFMNLHEPSNMNVFRARCEPPLEDLLFRIVKIINDKSLQIHSLNVTLCNITLLLAGELTESQNEALRDEILFSPEDVELGQQVLETMVNIGTEQGSQSG
jgi:hypothetical protein